MEVIATRGSHRHPDCSIDALGRVSFMEVVAVAERERQWRWEIRHGGQLVRESRAEFPTLQDAIRDGKQQLHSLWIGDDRPQVTRKSQCWRRAAG